jgi:cyclic pyranopterin phosphate synthase
MVNVAQKPVQTRHALAEAILRCAPATLALLRANSLPKGDAFAVARVAGIQAAKRTADLIPLCHPLPLHQAAVTFELGADHIVIRAEASTAARTGVEMEALTAAAVAGLTLYDMLKSADKHMVIDQVRLLKKTKK